MRGRPTVALALCLLAGCAGERWSYTKRGLTPADLDRDLAACRKQAQRPYTFALTQSRRVDQKALNRCMEQKGYTAHPDVSVPGH